VSDPTRPGWSNSFMRAWKGEFSRGVRQKEPAPEVRITTTAYDADQDKLEKLGKLTPNEARLFRQGGFTAVIEDRRFYAREKGDPTWNEIGTKRYGISKTPPGAIPTWLRQPEETGQGETEDRGSVQLPPRGMPEANRPSVGAPGDGQGPSRGRVQADEQDEPRDGQAEDGTQRLRARTRPGEMVGRSENRTARQTPPRTRTVQTLRPEDQSRVGKADEKAIPASTRGVKRGRPKKYRDDRERWRANKRQRRGR